MQLPSPTIAVICHLYYFESWEMMKSKLVNVQKHNPVICINVCLGNENRFELIKKIKSDFPDSIILNTPNKGKDIGGKLALIDLYINLNLQCDYILLLHDKVSPHTGLGEIWRNNLFKIVEPLYIEEVLTLFAKSKDVGIVSSKEFIVNEYNKKTDAFNCTSNQILKQLIKDYSLQLKTYDYVGGTMFWIRAEIFNSFFKKHSALQIRSTLENGNVLDHHAGTVTHSWERMLSWIASHNGYDIKGI